tara:strand:+ start:219 stop:941 length:723 start_codon:yes stop_codon:yes gene_type:complete
MSNEGKKISNVPAILSCRGLRKIYQDGDKQVEVLSGINFSLAIGEKVAIVGSSGSGKSTLLNILGGLDEPSAGEVVLDNTNFTSITESRRCQIRNQQMGFVYQFHHLLDEFSAVENVAMPLLIGSCNIKEARKRAFELLDRVSLSGRTEHKPGELSGGERQRVAIARALVTRPACVFMDEPTGNLDQHSAEQLLDLIDTLSVSSNSAFVVATHDKVVAGRMDRILALSEGLLRPTEKIID